MEICEILQSEESRLSFLLGLAFIAKIDGVVDDEEKFFFNNAAESLFLSPSSIQMLQDAWATDDCQNLKFSGKIEKIFFLREAVQLCHVNGGYTEEEKEAICKLALHLGVADSTVNAIEEWANKGMAWKTFGDKLLRLEG